MTIKERHEHDNFATDGWSTNGSTLEKRISLAYLTMAIADKMQARETSPYLRNEWENCLWRDPLAKAYKKASSRKGKGEIPTPKEYKKCLLQVLRSSECDTKEYAYGYSENLYEAVRRAPLQVTEEDTVLLSDRGYAKAYSVKKWKRILEKHLLVCSKAYNNLLFQSSSYISWMSYVYTSIEDYDPLWLSFGNELYVRKIHCSDNFWVALDELVAEAKLVFV